MLSELSQWTRKTTALITWGVAAIEFKFETCLGKSTANAANFKLSYENNIERKSSFNLLSKGLKGFHSIKIRFALLKFVSVSNAAQKSLESAANLKLYGLQIKFK